MRRHGDPEDFGLESSLRHERPRPARELAHRIGLMVERSERPRTASGRIVIAASVTCALLVVAGALGGIGRAASSVEGAATAVRTAVAAVTIRTVNGGNQGGTANSQASGSSQGGEDSNGEDGNDEGDDNDPGDDQYKPGKGCGDTQHVHFKAAQCKDEKNK
jgi:hypothetical protein